MKLGKISRKLRREVGAHPVKAAVLGILCLVALWFWAPLLQGWLTPRRPGSTASQAVQPGTPQRPGGSPTALAVPAPDSDSKTAVYPWRQIVQWMEQDPRTRPVAPAPETGQPAAGLADDQWLGKPLDAGFRDPFFRSEPAEKEQAKEAAAEPPPAPPAVRPQDLGASVSGIISGPDGGAAVINERTYLEGEEVLLRKDGMAYAFHVAEIRPGTVVLTRDGARYELDIQKASWKTDEPIP